MGVLACAESKRGGRGTFESDKPPVLTLVRRTDGRVRFLVCEDLQDAGEDIAEYGDGSVILCTDDYTIYNDIEETEGADGHLAVAHSDTYVIGDAHTNTCENRHSFLRQWLAKFRGVSKHHLQKYLSFLALKLNSPDDWFEKLLCLYRDERHDLQKHLYQIDSLCHTMGRGFNPISRRDVIKTGGTAGVTASIAALAGCMGGDGGNSNRWICGTSGQETSTHATATAFSSALDEHSDLVSMSPQTTGGTVANNSLINEGTVDVGISPHLCIWHAMEGEYPYQQASGKTLCQTFSYMTLDNYLVRRNNTSELDGVETLADIPEGAAVSFGPRGNSGALNLENVCRMLDIDFEERWNYSPTGLSDQTDELNEGRLDVALVYSVNRESHGSGWIEELDATVDIEPLNIAITQEDTQESERPVLHATIDASEHWNQDVQASEITVLPLGYNTVIPAEINNEGVYEYTKVLLDNHQAVREYTSQLSQHGPDIATQWLEPSLPVHPGAEEYLREEDLWSDNLTSLDNYER